MDGNGSSSYEMDVSASEELDAARSISTAHIQRLVRLVDESDVSELEVKRAAEGFHIVLRKAKAQAGSVMVSDQEALAPVSDEKTSQEMQHTVTAPLVGIFHAWGKTKGKELVAVGDQIKVGQLLGTIQSLNVFNEVESRVSRRIF
jgi:acetyl-CoA carboxylase biotin carboxyl carrier protein